MRNLHRPRPGASGPPSVDEPRSRLRLDSNENPYGCSLLVQESLSICDSFAAQPDGVSPTLLGALCRYAACRPSALHLENTREELLEHVFRVLVGTGACLPVWGPVDTPVLRAAERVGIRLDVHIAAPGTERDGPASVSEIAAAAGVVFVTSPNEVTGASVPALEVGAALRAGIRVILDETYREYSENAPGVLGREFDGLVSLRSFGSWAGLWGIPVSYAVSDPETTARLEAAYPSDALTRASRVAAGASLDDAAALLGRVRQIRKERGRLYRQLRKLNIVQPFPSDGPALICAVTRGDSRTLTEALRSQGVLVRDCAELGLPGFIRVSVGTPEETDVLMDSMRAVASRG